MGIGSAFATLFGVSAAVATPIAAPPSPVVRYVVESARPHPKGGAGTLLSAGTIQDIDQNTEVRGDKWYGQPGIIGIAGKMLRDAHVRKSIDYVVHPLGGAKWRFRPASSDPLDLEVADFLTWSFFERLPWAQVVRRVGVSYFSNGFALEEMTDDLGAIPANRFKLHQRPTAALIPTGFHQRPAWTVRRWHQSSSNPTQLESIEQYLMGGEHEKSGFRTVPADRLLRFTWDQDGADFEGLAILRSAYGPYKLKTLFQSLSGMGHERHAVGNPILTASEDASDEDLDAAESALAEMRSNEKGYAILPFGYTFKWESGGAGTDVQTAIEACNKDIAINVGAGHMMLGLGGKNAGSYALASTQQGQLHLEVDSHARFIASTLVLGSDGWSPVERIVRANYGSDVAVPHAEALNLPTRDWESVARTYGTLVAQQAVRRDGRTEDAIRESVGLPPYDPATAIESAPSPVVSAAAFPGGNGAPDDEPADEEQVAA